MLKKSDIYTTLAKTYISKQQNKTLNVSEIVTEALTKLQSASDTNKDLTAAAQKSLLTYKTDNDAEKKANILKVMEEALKLSKPSTSPQSI